MSRGHYSAHLERLTIPIHSPFWARTHRGAPAMITPQQFKLVVHVFSGWKGNQRDLAFATGYSLAGLNDAIASLSGLGIISRMTRRGRHGWTRLRIVAGTHATNVRERISTVLRTALSTLPNIRQKEASGERQQGSAMHVPHEVPPAGGRSTGQRPLAWEDALR